MKVDVCKLGELSIKYANKGFTIDFEFDRGGLILRGYLDLTVGHVEFYKFTKEYSYEMLKSLSDDVDIEFLVDEFKEEVFAQYKKIKERWVNEHKTDEEMFEKADKPPWVW